MAAFIDAMNAKLLTTQGVKGATVYTEEGVGDQRLVLYQLLVRHCPSYYVDEQIHKAFNRPTATNEELRDYLVLAFQTRDIRGGKGERDLFYTLLLSIFKERPQLIKKTMNLIPEYGCWQDCWKLWNLSRTHPFGEEIQKTCMEFVRWIFFEDLAKSQPSVLGKWMPREGSKYDALAKEFANDFYPGIELQDDRLRQYRKDCSKLNAQLKTVEVDMCRKTWAKINPATVPGRLLKKNRKAFLNEELRGGHLRRPSNVDRMECRQHFMDHTLKALSGKATVRAANVVYPHEIVQALLNNILSTEEEQLLQAQWNALRDKAKETGMLRGCVPMSDFSGSMAGTPLYVSLALGILLSEINEPAFKDYLLGFDADPSWINFTGMTTLREKINHALRFAQGLNTDFFRATSLILRKLVDHAVPPSQAPKDLIVFTDMGFDAAAGHTRGQDLWETQLTTIKKAFVAAGYTAPRIVLWNLRSEYRDFHAKADTEGVVILSGWSPSALQILQTKGVVIQSPYEALRELLDAPRYDLVRDAWALSM
jgi:hypothetical protein